MTGYTVRAHESKLNAVFDRAALVEDLELQADLARHLCVLVSGFLEQAVRHIYGSYAAAVSHPRVVRYVERQLAGYTNANCAKLVELAGAFDATWRADLDGFLVDETKDAIDSVVANRHQIVHGRDVGITYIRAKAYYLHVRAAVAFIENQTT